MDFVRFAVKETPTLILTTINHYVRGPPQPSWGLKFHLGFKLIQSGMNVIVDKTIEQLQTFGDVKAPIPVGMTARESMIGNGYRREAQIHLDRILKPYEHVLDTEWKDLKDDGVTFEWVQVSCDGWESRKVRKTILYLHGGGYIFCSRGTHRNITSTLAKRANARVFVIEYRLAPQNQFPAALQDALAAYLYLLDPPKDAEFEPLNPENIILAGDSAGGGLAIALGLAIRDAGLPSCAGIIAMSPWVDLTFSTPSLSNDRCNITDYVPGSILQFVPSPALVDYKRKVAALTARVKKQNLGPKVWHDSFDKPDVHINMYVPNEGLAIPYASPMLAESLGDLPPLLLIAGDVERLRDEAIYLAHRSAEPAKYKGPSYNAGKFEKSPFQTPTNTTLEIYEDMPHAFHFFDFHIHTEISYQRMIEFIDRVIDTNEMLPPSSYNSISSKGINPLNEKQKKVLECETIGIVPDLLRTETEVIPHQSIPKSFMFTVLLLAIIVYYA